MENPVDLYLALNFIIIYSFVNIFLGFSENYHITLNL